MDDFARTWLGITKPSAWREAVSTALLGDWTGAGCTCGVNNDTVVVHLLMEETRILHRQLQPLWECNWLFSIRSGGRAGSNRGMVWVSLAVRMHRRRASW